MVRSLRTVFFVIYWVQNVSNIKVRRGEDFSKGRKGSDLYWGTEGVGCFVSLMPLKLSFSLFWLIITYFSTHLPFSPSSPFPTPFVPPHNGYRSYKCNSVFSFTHVLSSGASIWDLAFPRPSRFQSLHQKIHLWETRKGLSLGSLE